jgi:hypothetical protein
VASSPVLIMSCLVATVACRPLNRSAKPNAHGRGSVTAIRLDSPAVAINKDTWFMSQRDVRLEISETKSGLRFPEAACVSMAI